MSDSSKEYSNRLVSETSPYLQQHAHNPVDWYPWGEEAFREAKEQDKPIFLSIGYSTCHWCHVMEKESFEDEEVAQLMNDSFISIKVDREERPDIDKVYMQVSQMMTGRGGWPLTVIMTPEKEPFFAGTYFPKRSRAGQIGMIELIPRISELWRDDRKNVSEVVERITNAIEESTSNIVGELDLEDIDMAFRTLSQRFDTKYGGFGISPKFPSPHNLMFLLRYWKRTGDEWALEMVRKTLINMRFGGLYDQIGYGFHRYSTDREWLVPHFEKMLYDQAMLMIAYSETFQATKEQIFADVVTEVSQYLVRDMLSPEGAFYSAEDADSEEEEGKFYVWKYEELNQILDDEEFSLFIRFYNISKEGNYLDEATQVRNEKNIPHLSSTVTKFSKQSGESYDDLKEKIENIRVKLHNHRANRIRPSLDDKILTDWNSLMIAALAIAYRSVKQEKLLQLAINAMDFLLENMLLEDGRLMHSYKREVKNIPGFLDDYAFILWALLEMYESTFDSKYLETSLQIVDRVKKEFWDSDEGGFFFTSENSESLIIRQKEAYDGAIPSGNSVMMYNLVRLARILADSEFENMSRKIGISFSEQVKQQPSSFTMMLNALDMMIGPSYEVIIAGRPEDELTDKMIDRLYSVFLPNKIVLLRGNERQAKSITSLAPYTKFYNPLDEKATAYVCIQQNCQLPTSDPEKMMELLREE